MSERYGQLAARVEAIGQLRTVVTAMRGIAGARAIQARGDLAAVDGYAALIAAAVRRLLALAPTAPGAPGGTALVVFGAEQGFAGAFTERILDALGDAARSHNLFLIGTRAASVAAERGIEPAWTASMPLHPNGVSRLAGRVAAALFARIATGDLAALDVVWSDSEAAASCAPPIVRRRLFPVALVSHAEAATAPLLALPPETLLRDLVEDYVHAQLCAAALNAFAAENEARLAAMAAARTQTDRKLDTLSASLRQVRQEEITSEILEIFRPG